MPTEADPASHLVETIGINEAPTWPGWYLARMKTRPRDAGREIVKVTRLDSRTLEVWQPGDGRAWTVAHFDWFAQIFP